jgi:D-alanyl-D-alanine carboxypeptidase
MKLLYLSLAFVVLVLSIIVTFPYYKRVSSPQVLSVSNTASALPILKENSIPPIISAQGVIAVDANSAVILYEKNSDQPLFPASTTKMMTALVALEHYPPDDIINVGLFKTTGQRMGLKMGEELTVKDLIAGLLIFSANDAAEVLASHFPDGREAFINEMNKTAKELGMLNTHFANPSGLDQEGHVSTARDLMRLAEVAMRREDFSTIVAIKDKTVQSRDGKFKHRLTNINQLLGKVEGVKGVKTGWTENARENLVTYIDRDGKRVFITLLGSQDRFGETTELINWIYQSYDWQKIEFTYSAP